MGWKTPRPRRAKFSELQEKQFLHAEKLRAKARVIERGLGGVLSSDEYFGLDSDIHLELLTQANALRNEAASIEARTYKPKGK